MKIYNTFTRKKQEFVPVINGHVGMYVCGPTVYGLPHLGHAKSYTSFDLINRYLRYKGFKVKYVQNITDVGHLVGDSDDGQDKIAKQAKIEQLDAYEIAYKYEVEYFNAMDKLNILRPSISCRATGFVYDMIAAVQEIINKGYAYVTKDGNVYFDVYKYPKYGQLSNRTLDKNLSGERIEIASDKKHNEDFALWKNVGDDALMKWQSPWGQGCPGWHIECTVLGRKFLGEHFDIHGGGIDNIFPHHECECAQADVLNGHIPMNFFMHNGLVTVNGTKMGKSLGNSATLLDLYKKYDPMVIRYLILCSHYRSNVDFSDNALLIAKNQYDKINAAVCKLREITNNKVNVTIPELVNLKNAFIKAMDDDFNSPVAISEFIKLQKMIMAAVNSGDKNVLEQLNTLVFQLGEEVLGLKFSEVKKVENIVPNEIQELAKQRWQAKINKDWANADLLRAKLEEKGYVIRDNANGYEIIKNKQ